jgi:hypothetical protein
MEAHEVTPANLHLAVGLLLTNQQIITKRLDAQDSVLGAIKEQTIKTNGRVLAAETAIIECKAGVKEALATACPGTCLPLAEKVRSLEDSRLEATSNLAGARWVIASAVAAGGFVASVVGWLLQRPAP